MRVEEHGAWIGSGWYARTTDRIEAAPLAPGAPPQPVVAERAAPLFFGMRSLVNDGWLAAIAGPGGPHRLKNLPTYELLRLDDD